jgi:hypothetical protein
MAIGRKFSTNSSLTIRKLHDLFSNGMLYLRPSLDGKSRSFQRLPWWEKKRKSYLIHSIYEGTTIPPIFVYEDRQRRLCIVDGQQRLCAIFDYLDDKFKVTQAGLMEKEIETVSEFIAGKKFSALESTDQDRIKDFELRIETIEPPTSWELASPGFRAFLAAIKNEFHRLNVTSRSMSNAEMWNNTYRGIIIDIAYYLQEQMGLTHPGVTDTSVDLRLALEKYYLATTGICTRTDILRMEDVDLILQLMFLVSSGEPNHKEDGLREFLQNNESMSGPDKVKLIEGFTENLGYIQDIFSVDEIKESEFCKKHDFYSLFSTIDLLRVTGRLNDTTDLVRMRNNLLEFSECVSFYGLVRNGKESAEEWSDYPISGSVQKMVEEYFVSRTHDWNTKKCRDIRLEILLKIATRKSPVLEIS